MLGLLLFTLFAFSGLIDLIWKVIYDIYVFLLAKRLGHLIDLKAKGGEWAVVTGAGAGIGRGYALALAAKGINVCLIGRTESNLKAVADEIVKKYQVETKVCVHDFAQTNNDDALNIKTAIGPQFEKIGILINNVGVMGGGENFGSEFVNNSPDPLSFSAEMINVNVQSMVLMTGMFLPNFVKQRRGVVINLASACAIRPFYGSAVYSATKAFVDFFSEGIRQEIEAGDSQVIIQTVYPFFVKTSLIPKVSFDTFPSILAPRAESFSRHALNTVGLQECTSGCLQHNLQNHTLRLLDSALPKQMLDWIMRKMLVGLAQLNNSYIETAKKSQ